MQTDTRADAAAVDQALRKLCAWAASVQSGRIADRIMHRAMMVFADDLSILLATADDPTIAAGQDYLLRTPGRAESTVFALRPTKAARDRAGAANGLAITWTVLDEGYRDLPCHAGSYILPALLAEAEAIDVPFDRMLRALALAYEITVRFARCFRFPDATLHSHAVFGPLGATAGIALLRGFKPEQLRRSLCAASTFAMAGPLNHTKLGGNIRSAWTALGAQSGFLAADLPSLGFNALDSAPFDAFVTCLGTQAMVEELNGTLGGPMAIEHGYHKAYACCQYLQGVVEASLTLADGAAALPASEIVGIVVETHDRALFMRGQAPQNVLAAKFSVEHAAAVVAARRSAIAADFGDRGLADPEVARLRDLVRVSRHPRTGEWPMDRPSRVEWRFASGERLTADCNSARGGRDRPFTEEELLDKIEAQCAANFPRVGPRLRALVCDAPTGKTSGMRQVISRLIA